MKQLRREKKLAGVDDEALDVEMGVEGKAAVAAIEVMEIVSGGQGTTIGGRK